MSFGVGPKWGHQLRNPMSLSHVCLNVKKIVSDFSIAKKKGKHSIKDRYLFFTIKGSSFPLSFLFKYHVDEDGLEVILPGAKVLDDAGEELSALLGCALLRQEDLLAGWFAEQAAQHRPFFLLTLEKPVWRPTNKMVFSSLGKLIYLQKLRDTQIFVDPCNSRQRKLNYIMCEILNTAP